jgi:hypothetical protein
VARAVAARGAAFDALVFLAAEVDDDGAADFPPPTAARAGLALRIGGAAVNCLSPPPVEMARAAVARAEAVGVAVTELQLDVDAPSSALDDYAGWVSAVEAALEPLPVTFTALPDWLRQPTFPALADAADGYVLQVHSLTLGRAPEDATVIDPARARDWVEAAGRLGRPFRVALPTHGFRLRAGLARADPGDVAPLVAGWTADRPLAMTGLIWFRLPVDGEVLNWPWITLRAVMAGQTPRGAIAATARAEATRDGGALVTVSIAAGGSAEVAAAPLAVSWSGPLIAADGLGGYLFERAGAASGALTPPPDTWLRPGDRRDVAWLRLETPAPVVVHVVDP